MKTKYTNETYGNQAMCEEKSAAFYHFIGETLEKGAYFCVQRLFQHFRQNHGLEAKMHSLGISSSKFEGIIEGEDTLKFGEYVSAFFNQVSKNKKSHNHLKKINFCKIDEERAYQLLGRY